MNTESGSAELFKIIAVSALFHFAIIASLAIIIWLRPEKETPPPIPFFEMVNVALPPPPALATPQTPRQPSAATPQSEGLEPITPVPQTTPEQLPEPIPEQIIPQTPRPSDTPLKEGKEPTATAAPEQVQPAQTPSMDMPDMEMPTDIKSVSMDMPAVEGIGRENPCFNYVMRINGLTMQNFNPPSGTDIASGTKSKVGFTLTRSGEIAEVILKESSGNAIWDRLAVRAVQITKVPPFPPECTNEQISVNFNFVEK